MGDYAEVLNTLRERGEQLAVAESLTGGLLCARFVDIPGASAVLGGGVTTYTNQIKTRVLGVDEELLETGGAVQEQVARQMACAVARLYGAEAGVSTTGVAGPEPVDGHPVGTVFLGCCYRGKDWARQLQISGDRSEIRDKTCTEAARFLLEVLQNE